MSTDIAKEVREYVKKEYPFSIFWAIVDYDDRADPVYSIRIGKEEHIYGTVQFITHQAGESYSLYDDVCGDCLLYTSPSPRD